MGAKTGLLVYADGEVPDLLRRVGTADLVRTSAMMQRLYPACDIEPHAGAELWDGVYPPKGTAYAAGWPGQPAGAQTPPVGADRATVLLQTGGQEA